MATDENLTKGERTRQALVDAAYGLFLENGYSATSMRQIAERAGLALGGIYNHFSSKDEIFQALMINKHPIMRIFPVLQVAPGNTTDEFIHNVARLVKTELGEDPNFMKLMFIEIVEFNGKHLPALISTIFPMALPMLERFMSPGCGVRDNLPTLKLVRMLVGNILAFYLTELMLSSSALPAGLRDVSLDDFLETFLHGIMDPQQAKE